MKPVEKIDKLLESPICAEWFEMHHQFKCLKIEINKLQKQLRECRNDKYIMEQHLNATINEVSRSNDKIKRIRRRELKENERRFQNEVSKLKQITTSMTSSMAYIDRDYTYRYINDKYTEWFGVKKEDIIDKTISQAAGEAFFKMYQPIYDKIFAGESMTLEIDTHIANTTNRLVCQANYVPAYDLEGNNIGAYIYGTDITENKVKEELLQKSQLELKTTNSQLKEYIESNVQLEQFAFVAAHDMKAPMRSIASFSDLLKGSLKDVLSEKQSEYFEYISTGTKRLSALVTDLLNYSKVDGHDLDLVQTDIKNIVSQVMQYLAVSIEEKNADIQLVNLPTDLTVDKIKIYQVFQNLIANAIKFTKENISPRVNISCKDMGDKYEFRVQDNGIGIDPEYHADIFESFKQVNNKSQYEGTGLGLAICKKIVEHHNGQIKLESSPGEGSTFIFTIPKNLGE